jgi:hypothetical protein
MLTYCESGAVMASHTLSIRRADSATFDNVQLSRVLDALFHFLGSLTAA